MQLLPSQFCAYQLFETKSNLVAIFLYGERNMYSVLMIQMWICLIRQCFEKYGVTFFLRKRFTCIKYFIVLIKKKIKMKTCLRRCYLLLSLAAIDDLIYELLTVMVLLQVLFRNSILKRLLSGIFSHCWCWLY